MNRLNDVALLLLRVGVSLLMMTHGWGKMEKLLAGGEIEFYDFLGLGPKVSLALTVFGELIAPVFIVIGLFTRWAALPVVITMGVAALMVHAGDPLGEREPSLIYMICFLVVLLMGPGNFSLDQRIGKKR